MEFTYNGMVRYGFGFDNPNHAAALITILLPIFWTIRFNVKKRSSKSLCLIIETILYTALFYTYSRAGILTVLICGLLFICLRWYALKEKLVVPDKFHIAFYSIGTILLVSTFFYSGIATRIAKSFTSPDKAMTNRFDVWQGGLRMLADVPHGVGTGLSGKIYTIFLLPPESRLGYRTMVNSFLTFAVEQGIYFAVPVFLFMLLTTLFSLLILNKKSKYKNIIICSITSIAAGTLSGLLSTCFDISLPASGTNNLMQYLLLTLWLAPFAILIAMLYTNRVQLKTSLTTPAARLLLGIVVIVALSGCLITSTSNSKNIDSPSKGIVVINKNSKTNNLIVPDFNRGNIKQQINSIMALNENKSFTVVLDPEFPTGKLQNISTVFIYGNGQFTNLPTGADIHLVNPPPPEELHIPLDKVTKVYLDPYDENGYNFLWQQIFPKGNKIIYTDGEDVTSNLIRFYKHHI